MARKSNISAGAFFLILAIGIALVVGWILNIAAIVNADEITAMVALRIAAIFVAPLGGILGYI